MLGGIGPVNYPGGRLTDRYKPERTGRAVERFTRWKRRPFPISRTEGDAASYQRTVVRELGLSYTPIRTAFRETVGEIRAGARGDGS